MRSTRVLSSYGCASLLLAALLLACAVPLHAAKPVLQDDLHTPLAQAYFKASRRLRSLSSSDASGWSKPSIQTGNRIGMDSGPTAQEQTAAVAIEQHVAVLDQGPAGAASASTQRQDRLRSWLHPQLAHGKHMAFDTGGVARQQEDTVDAIRSDAGAISAGAGRKLLYTHHRHHATNRYNQQATEDIGATTAAEAESVDSVEQQAADIEENAATATGSRKLLGPQDWRHPQLAHGKHMAFETGGAARQQEDTIDAIEADADSIASTAG